VREITAPQSVDTASAVSITKEITSARVIKPGMSQRMDSESIPKGVRKISELKRENSKER